MKSHSLHHHQPLSIWLLMYIFGSWPAKEKTKRREWASRSRGPTGRHVDSGILLVSYMRKREATNSQPIRPLPSRCAALVATLMCPIPTLASWPAMPISARRIRFSPHDHLSCWAEGRLETASRSQPGHDDQCVGELGPVGRCVAQCRQSLFGRP